MDESSYTTEEFRQALKDTGHAGLAESFTDTITEQMDKNRAVKQGTGFTGKQVHTAVANVLIRDHGYSAFHAASLASAVIRQLGGSQEPVEGGVYRSPAGVLYKRSGTRWTMFGLNTKLTDDELNYPVSELERVL